MAAGAASGSGAAAGGSLHATDHADAGQSRERSMRSAAAPWALSKAWCPSSRAKPHTVPHCRLMVFPALSYP